MRSLLPWLAFFAMALIAGWLAEDRAELQTRTQSAVPQGMSSSATDGSESSDVGQMHSTIQSLQAELAEARKVIAEDAEEREAATAREETLAADYNASIQRLTSHRSFAAQQFAPQLVPHYTGGPKRRWGHEQATGAPDTSQAGDIPTAWASKNPDGGVEWLELDYERAVDVGAIRVHESNNPGAISKLAVIRPDGGEETVWEGNLADSARNELLQSDFKVSRSMLGQKVRVYMDTGRVPGWNEIDAVQLVGKDGTQQWAVGSSASSSYSDP